jgi:hypothetical protein
LREGGRAPLRHERGAEAAHGLPSAAAFQLPPSSCRLIAAGPYSYQALPWWTHRCRRLIQVELQQALRRRDGLAAARERVLARVAHDRVEHGAQVKVALGKRGKGGGGGGGGGWTGMD